MKQILCLLPLLLLTAACAGKSVYTPKPGAQAVSDERSVQEGLANGGKGTGEYTGELQSTDYYMGVLNKIAPRIKKAGVEVCRGIGRKTCDFGFKLVQTKELNAYADGKNVHITMGMMAFAASEDDIATILAHEYAHNILAHVASTQQNVTVGALGGTVVDALLQSQGINTGGQLGKLGANYAQMKYSKTFEQEADHVGLYIAYHAGYPIENAANFWRRMSTANPNAIYTATTHPTNPERFVAMNDTVAEINRKKAAGQPLFPDVKKD